MGNTSGKERSSSPPNSHPNLPGHSRSASSSSSRYRAASTTQERSSSSMTGSSSRVGRESRNRNLNIEHALFGLGFASSPSRAERSITRREDEREAREARRAEREREKEAERQRSLREESLDGGFLVTQGIYTGTQDFKEKIVRHLMIERKLAPFWKGLPDYDDNWTDAQLMSAFCGLPIPPPDAEIPPDISEPTSRIKTTPSDDASESNLHLTVPIASRSRSQSYTSDSSGRSAGISSIAPVPSRARSKTISISSPQNPVQLTSATNPLETNIPGVTIDGRPIELVLYREAKECPICFLYYPPWQNKTRCCDQEICSECFVQIKRADPHLPHDNPENQQEGTLTNPDLLISEPACCPFCKEADFGVVYAAPPFRRGLIYTDSVLPADLAGLGIGSSVYDTPQHSIPNSPTSPSSPPPGSMRRRAAYASTAPEVVTTDMIRPDWAHKLAAARSQAARRAAAATALHTAAFLLSATSSTGPGGSGSSGTGYSTRRLIRRSVMGSQGSESPSPANSGTGTPRRNSTGHGTGVMGNSYGGFGIGALSERNASPVVGGGRSSSSGVGDHGSTSGVTAAGLSLLGVSSGRDRDREREEASSRRRSRLIDLEEMMLREAIRLSLVEEEDRKKREDKETKEKEKDKREKSSPRKSFFGSLGGNNSANALDIGEGNSSSAGKGKTVDRSGSGGIGQSPTKPLSSASSASSLDSRPHPRQGQSANNSKDNLEEFTLSFSSLAGMVEDEDGCTNQESALMSTSEWETNISGEKLNTVPIIESTPSFDRPTGKDSSAIEAGVIPEKSGGQEAQ